MNKEKKVDLICSKCKEKFFINTPKNIDLRLGRPVEQITVQGVLKNTFKSIIEASRETGINRASINHVCTGRQKTAGGYNWQYKNHGKQ